MPAKNIATNAMPADDIAALDLALADFDLDDNDGEIIEPDMTDEEADELTLAGDVNEDVLMELDTKLEMQETYQEQEAAGSIEDIDGAKAAGEKPAKKTSKEKKASTASAGAKTRTPRDINVVPDLFFVLTTGTDPADMSTDELAEHRTDTMLLKPTQKKVAEKFENLFTALSVAKAPSRYTMMAFSVLDAKKSMTSTDLVGAYKAAGLDEGTARSQAGQLMNLFAAVKIADRAGQTLTLRSDSLLAERIRNLPAAA